MTRDDKLELARELTRRLLARHGEQAIVAVGVHGPVARGDPDPAASLDLAVITASPEVEVPERALRHRGCTVEIGALWADAYLEEAGHVGPTWPLASGQFTQQLALHDPGGFFHKLRHVHEQAMAAAEPASFAGAAGYDLVQALHRHALAEAALAAGDPLGATLALHDGLLFAALVVGLLGRTSFHDRAHAVRSAAAGPGAPTGFGEPYRRAIDPASGVDAAVAALGGALAALAAQARHDGIPFETDDPAALA